jgi:hypothetical protein
VEDLGRSEPSAQVGRDRLHHRLVHLFPPPVGRHEVGHRAALLLLQPGPERGDVVQQPAGLVLARVDPGAQEQLTAVLAGFGHPGPDPQPVPGRGTDQLDLLGVEAELVEPPQPLGDAVPLLVRAQDLLPGQLLPQRGVPAAQLLGDVQRVDVGRQQLARLQVEQLAKDPLRGQFQVVVPLPGGQLRVLLAGLRVDQVGLQRAGVVPEQRVGQRAVAPEEPGQVQPDQQLDQRVQQPVGRLAAAWPGEHGPVGGGVGEKPRDQDRVHLGTAVHRDPDYVDRGDAQLVQRPQQRVLAAGQPFGQLLERVQYAVVLDETDDVPVDPALADLHQPLVLPVRQGLVPRQ